MYPNGFWEPNTPTGCLLDFDFGHHWLAAFQNGLVLGDVKLITCPGVLMKHQNDHAASFESRGKGNFDLAVGAGDQRS
jgi:hypothetical protein